MSNKDIIHAAMMVEYSGREGERGRCGGGGEKEGDDNFHSSEIGGAKLGGKSARMTSRKFKKRGPNSAGKNLKI